jgi:hypothetical protein
MPHPLPALSVVVAAPLLGLALHAPSTHATGRPAVRVEAALPNNLCASCHGGRKVAALGDEALDARDLVAARTYLRGAPSG